jgi:hypothetical protein
MEPTAPLGVWDTREHGFWSREGRWFREVVEWAQEHIAEADRTYRAEFYLIDAPFVVLYRYTEDGQGRKIFDPAADGPACDEPVVQPLDELPPQNLLGAP